RQKDQESTVSPLESIQTREKEIESLATPLSSTYRGYLKEEIGSLQKTVHELSSRLESANDPTVRDRLREAKDRLGAASQEGDLVDIVRRPDGRLRDDDPKP